MIFWSFTVMKLSNLEIFLLQVILYAVIWLADEYVASYMCIVLPGIILAILLISLIVELIEPSRISKRYFVIMGLSILAPVLTGLAFYTLYDGQLEWLQGF